MEEVLLQGTPGTAIVRRSNNSKQEDLLSDLQSHFVYCTQMSFSAYQQGNPITSELVAWLCCNQESC